MSRAPRGALDLTATVADVKLTRINLLHRYNELTTTRSQYISLVNFVGGRRGVGRLCAAGRRLVAVHRRVRILLALAR